MTLAKIEETFVFSPASIESVLMMIFLGAKNETYDEIAQIFPLDLSEEILKEIKKMFYFIFSAEDRSVTYEEFVQMLPSRPSRSSEKILKEIKKKGQISFPAENRSVDCTITNAIWKNEAISFQFNEEYRKIINEFFDCEIFKITTKNLSQSLNQINTFIKEKTHGLIPSALSLEDLRESIPLAFIITNVIYFHGRWLDDFDEKLTRIMPFYQVNGKTVDIPFMEKDCDLTYSENDLAQYLEIPFMVKPLIDPYFKMGIILPKDRFGIKEFEKVFSASMLNELISSMKSQKVMLQLPKIKKRFKLDLKKLFQLMGIKHAFNETADFSGISETHTSISKALHEVFFELDEHGVKASAFTGFFNMLGGPKPIPFIVDHPFICLIRELQTNTIIFLGRISSFNGVE